jgi:hypothetical protein
VVTVEVSSARVEMRLVAGQIACPGCGAGLRPWGWSGRRVVRDFRGLRVELRPRRSRCPGCGVSHVLLPVTVLLRRADVVAVIGAALLAKASGAGHRRIAACLGLPDQTVRGWLRRFGTRAGVVREVFTVVLVEVAPGDPLVPSAAGSDFADAVAAVLGAAGAVTARWPGMALSSPWQAASVVSGGRLLSPGWSRSSINASCP